MNYARATRVAATVGQVLAFGFAFWGLGSHNFLLVLVAIFVYFGAGQEAAAAQMRDLARHVRVSEAMITEFATLPADARLSEAVEALLRTHQHDFPVVDGPGGSEVLGILTRNDMIRALREEGPDVPVTAVMRRDVPSVPVESPFDRGAADHERRGDARGARARPSRAGGRRADAGERRRDDDGPVRPRRPRRPAAELASAGGAGARGRAAARARARGAVTALT